MYAGRQLSLILGLIAPLSSFGYEKWFANVDKLDHNKSNLRILGLSIDDFILIYDNILSDEECDFILKALLSTKIRFVYMTDYIELE